MWLCTFFGDNMWKRVVATITDGIKGIPYCGCNVNIYLGLNSGYIVACRKRKFGLSGSSAILETRTNLEHFYEAERSNGVATLN